MSEHRCTGLTCKEPGCANSNLLPCAVRNPLHPPRGWNSPFIVEIRGPVPGSPADEDNWQAQNADAYVPGAGPMPHSAPTSSVTAGPLNPPQHGKVVERPHSVSILISPTPKPNAKVGNDWQYALTSLRITSTEGQIGPRTLVVIPEAMSRAVHAQLRSITSTDFANMTVKAPTAKKLPPCQWHCQDLATCQVARKAGSIHPSGRPVNKRHERNCQTQSYPLESLWNIRLILNHTFTMASSNGMHKTRMQTWS